MTSLWLSNVFWVASLNFCENSSIGPISSIAMTLEFFIASVIAWTPTFSRSPMLTRYLPIIGPVFWLTCASQKTGPMIGKYRVNIGDLENVGVQAITEAIKNSNVIAIDEIGPMELFSQKFRDATQKTLESHKLVIAVVHWKAQNRLINDAKNREDAETITVTPENRDHLSETILEQP